MIIAKHGLLSAARLRKRVDGIRRVMVTRTDGIALYDDVPLDKRDGAAALTAAVLGLSATASSSLDMAGVHFTVVMSDQGALFVYPIDTGHLLAVLADPDVDTGLLGDAALDELTALRRFSSGMAIAS